MITVMVMMIVRPSLPNSPTHLRFMNLQIGKEDLAVDEDGGDDDDDSGDIDGDDDFSDDVDDSGDDDDDDFGDVECGDDDDFNENDALRQIHLRRLRDL